MAEKIIDYLESIRMTIVSGVAILLSLILSIANVNIGFDFAWIAVIISGIPLVYSAVRKLMVNKGISKISSALLITIAMLAAIVIGDIFAAGEVAFIMALGELLEHKTTQKATKGLKKLISITPQSGRKLTEKGEETVLAEDIQIGDIIRILPGEIIPVDGEITVGETSVDQSNITGESLPIDKVVGDSVFSGTINCFGTIDIKALKKGSDSSLQKLIAMVKEAQNKKAPIQRIADKWASWLVPVSLLLAVIAYFTTNDIVRAVTILVVFCPCALVLATPTAIMAAIGQATKYGVIIKSGEALEKMGKVNTIAFDKTGTLTCGKLSVKHINSFNDMSSEELLMFAASAEQKSEHPLGKAIVNYAKQNKIALEEPKNFKMQSGKGISAVLRDKKMLFGNEKYMSENNVFIAEKILNNIKQLQKEGNAVVLVATENECIGVIALSDTLRKDSVKMSSQLEKLNTNSVLLTGDNKNTAEYFAKCADIKSVYAELLPEEKVDIVSKLQNSGNTVCMIGDGVNDAPALKTADVGIAMGEMGSDIAVESADITLIGDDISKIAYIKKLSNETVKTIKLSITLSLVINFIAIVMSFAGILTPTTGALVHNAGSIFVVLIAAHLYERKFTDK